MPSSWQRFSDFLEGPAAADRVRRVFDAADQFIVERAVTLEQRRLIGAPVARLRAEITADAERASMCLFVHLPVLVYAGLRGEERPAIPLASATTLLFAGLDLFDDVADGDWPGSAAATLLCAFPQLMVGELAAPPQLIAAIGSTLARGLLRMSAGQQQDLSAQGADEVRSCEIEATAIAKSGEEAALFACMAAQLAEAPEEIAGKYEELGRSIGAGAQLASDCHELFEDPAARDLVHGARTLPIVLHLERLLGAERTAFLALLDDARTEAAAREEVRLRLRSGGSLRRCAFIVETYRQRALRLCREAAPLEPARGCLEALIGSISFFP